MALARDIPHSFGDALRVARIILERHFGLVKKGLVETEAEQIVLAAYKRATGKDLSRVELFSRIKDRLPLAAGEAALVFATARAEGKLLQHIVGYQRFLDHDYEVCSSVLVPRPETEALVASAIAQLIGRKSSARTGIEIGVGSGIISIELLSRFPELVMLSSDFSLEAIKIASRNAVRVLGPEQAHSRLRLLHSPDQSVVWKPFDSAGAEGRAKADFLISNPPYLLTEEAEDEVVQHEPREALFPPGSDPLFFYSEIVGHAGRYLGEGGQIFVEIPHERVARIVGMFEQAGYDTLVIKDLSGRDRVLIASRD